MVVHVADRSAFWVGNGNTRVQGS